MANQQNAKRVGIAASALAAAAAAAAAGYYFYGSDDAPKNRRIAAKWANDMKNEVVRQAKKAKDIDRKQMLALIDGAAAAYETARHVDPAELSRARKELRDNWQSLVGELRGRAGGAKKRATKAAKKVAKKARTSTASKKKRGSKK